MRADGRCGVCSRRRRALWQQAIGTSAAQPLSALCLFCQRRAAWLAHARTTWPTTLYLLMHSACCCCSDGASGGACKCGEARLVPLYRRCPIGKSSTPLCMPRDPRLN
eukprot:1625223-Pleurochrysis_carterae.AAC.2